MMHACPSLIAHKLYVGALYDRQPWHGNPSPPLTAHRAHMLLQEEDEQSYKQHFPDHFSAFADVAELDDMPNLGDDSTAASAAAAEADSGLSEAEASSSAAQQLLHGAILADVVGLHARYLAVQDAHPCTPALLVGRGGGGGGRAVRHTAMSVDSWTV